MNENNNKKLLVSFFGNFSIRNEDGSVYLAFDDVITTKMIQLLQIILLNMKTPLSKRRIMEDLYAGEEIENINGTMNNTIFRLRKYMEKTPLLKELSLELEGGILSIKTDLDIETDVDKFTKAVEKISTGEDGKDKIDCCKEAYEIYTGDFLSQLQGETWVYMPFLKYQSQYFDVLRIMVNYYKKGGDFNSMLNIAAKASMWYPTEEWQILRIDSLLALNRVKEAMDVYKAYAGYNMSELGLAPSDEMSERYKIIKQKQEEQVKSWYTVQRDIQEVKSSGGISCDYKVFLECCDDLARLAQRVGMSTYLLCCDIESEHEMSAEIKKKVHERFEENLKKSLRYNDLYTRHGDDQYLVIIQGITRENCIIVTNRIDYNVGLLGLFGCGISYSVTDVGSFVSSKQDGVWKKVKDSRKSVKKSS